MGDRERPNGDLGRLLLLLLLLLVLLLLLLKVGEILCELPPGFILADVEEGDEGRRPLGENDRPRRPGEAGRPPLTPGEGEDPRTLPPPPPPTPPPPLDEDNGERLRDL